MNRDQLLQFLQTATAPLLRKLRLLAQRAVLVQSKYIEGVRVMQVRLPGGAALGDVEHLEPFGFTSAPPKGSEAIVLSLGGNTSHSLVLLCGHRRYKMQIAEGEAALYNQHGDFVHIKDNREIEVESAVKVSLNAPKTECTGDLNVLGKTTLQDTLTVAKAASLQDTLTVVGATTVSTLQGESAVFSAGLVVAGISFTMHFHDYTDNGNTMQTGGAKG